MSTIDKQKDLRDAALQGIIGHVKKYLSDDTVDVNGKGSNGWTALHYACWNEQRDIAELLLDHGADIEAPTFHNYTPLMWACCHGHVPTTKLLLERGSNVNAVNNFGHTVLHRACTSTGSKDCVEELLAHGADASIENKDGKTPLDLAQDFKNLSIVDLLTEHKKHLEQPIMDSVQDAKNSTMADEECSLKGEVPECMASCSTLERRLSSMGETINNHIESIASKEEETNQAVTKLTSDIDRRCEELRSDMIATNLKKMNQLFEKLTDQFISSNAEIKESMSNLSTRTFELEGVYRYNFASNEEASPIKRRQCEEVCNSTMTRNDQDQVPNEMAVRAFDVERKKDADGDFVIL